MKRFVMKSSGILSAFLISLMVASSAHAQGSGSNRMEFGLALAPTYIFMEESNFRSAFTNNGFAAPKKDILGFDWLVWMNTPMNWRLGLGGNMFGTSREVGGFAARYDNTNLGVYFGRDFLTHPNLDLTVGVLVGYGWAKTEVFSTNQNGRFTEGAFIAEPRITLDYLVGPFTKVGVKGSYITTVSQSTRNIGDPLGLNDTNAKGATVGLQVTFGNFGMTEF